MRYFVKYERSGVEIYASYDGMDEATVTTLITDLGGSSLDWLTEEEYNLGVAAQKQAWLDSLANE